MNTIRIEVNRSDNLIQVAELICYIHTHELKKEIPEFVMVSVKTKKKQKKSEDFIFETIKKK